MDLLLFRGGTRPYGRFIITTNEPERARQGSPTFFRRREELHEPCSRHWLQVFRAYRGPVHRTFDALREVAQEARYDFG
jgi:hypothetical protein